MRVAVANMASPIALAHSAGPWSSSLTTISAAPAAGVERLIAAICAGNVGAVLAIEASRLARNGRDWHTLIEFCGLWEEGPRRDLRETETASSVDPRLRPTPRWSAATPVPASR